ncbi:MAG: hypothetical protein KGL39_49410 [Patescibacteria group bacterium]|nr:hypothetical protein [Patescibacteria group bacterium]
MERNVKGVRRDLPRPRSMQGGRARKKEMPPVVGTPFREVWSVRAELFRMALRGTTLDEMYEHMRRRGILHPEAILKMLRGGCVGGKRWEVFERDGRFSIQYCAGEGATK